MNYSASESYYNGCSNFDEKRAYFKDLRPRWFRNYFVLYQSKGWFTHNFYPFDIRDAHNDLRIDKSVKLENLSGTYYGPFWSKRDAEDFGRALCNHHERFILG